MIRRIAVTVRFPGARTAPVMRTCTCCQTGREKTGAQTSMALLKAIGKESIAILSGEAHSGYHCRSIEFIPLSFWYDAPLRSRDSDRRHDHGWFTVHRAAVPPFEAAFHARMAAWRMDGKPRTARRFTVYQNCPLPTPEDRLLFILTYLKTYALQVVHGRLFGMVQGKANQWIHVLLPALLAALRALGDAPARSLAALAQRLGVSEADAATVVSTVEEEPAPVAPIPAAAPASPLLPMTGRNGAASAPKTQLNSKRVRAGRKRTTR